MPHEASSADTLRAWQKAIDIRERIIKGDLSKLLQGDFPMINQ